jgi:hypothetical protein
LFATFATSTISFRNAISERRILRLEGVLFKFAISSEELGDVIRFQSEGSKPRIVVKWFKQVQPSFGRRYC